MRRTILAGISCLVITLSFGQDLKVDVSKLSYGSEFEKKLIEAYQANSPDYFALLLAVDESVTADQYTQWKTTFENGLEAIKPELDTKKKNDKRIKFLYEKIHGRFLTKYENINLFSQVFKDGVYNCVSATALYGLAFNHLGIPYSVQEMPTHVFLVAYPETEQIKIETTTPVGGYFQFDEAFKQNYVKKMTNYKVISETEYQTKSVNELFDQHFFKSESIDLKQLVGIQYLNSGLYHMEKKEYEKAYYQFEKGYLFYPIEKSRYLMFASLASAFNGLKYSDEKKAEFLAKLSQYTKEGISQDMVLVEFYRINETVFLQDGNREKYEKIHTILQQSIQDENTKSQLAYIYNYENGRVFFNQGRYNEASPYLEKALAAKPNNVEMTGLFIANLEKLHSLEKDKVKYIKRLQKYSDTYPALKDHANFNYMLADKVLSIVTESYEKGNTKEGETYRLMFEDLVAKTSSFDANMMQFEIGRAYSAACVYYFKLGQKSKARIFVDKGLSYVPNNYQLRSRKEALR